MMFHDLANLLADDVICIAVGGFARELAPHLLEGTKIKLLNENIPLPHPSRSKNGWMTIPERDCMVRVACKIAEIICGGVPIVFANVKDIKMIQSVSGPMQFLELMRQPVMEELCAKRERKLAHANAVHGILEEMRSKRERKPDVPLNAVYGILEELRAKRERKPDVPLIQGLRREENKVPQALFPRLEMQHDE
jgi:hypothetical protein